MRNIRWLQLVVSLAALGLITATGSAQAADVSTGSTSSPAIGYCAPASQPAAGNTLSSRSTAAELCSQAGPVYVSTAGGWRVAGPANGGGTLSLVAFVARPATWRDAGATPVSAAAGWLAAIAGRGKFTTNPALFSGLELAWGDAGAGRR
jgi:hypothetical protein